MAAVTDINMELDDRSIAFLRPRLDPSELKILARPAPTDHQTEAVAFRFSPNVINESSEGFSCRKAAMPMDYVICVFQKVYDINTQHAAAC